MTEVLEQTPPIIHGPSDKEKKYDRQLRLWAANGQLALEDAHILLFNSGSGTVGVEALKNLVLPGIGRFTIAEDAIVNEADLGVNFFLEESDLGNSRAKSCVRLLQELNPDVRGDWFPKSSADKVEDILQTGIAFTLILYSHPIDQMLLEKIINYSIKHKIPLISTHSAGFYSYFKMHLPGNFPIIDTHPDSTATTDLRLLTPWPELVHFVHELTDNIDSLDAHKHGHIPYLILLLYYLNKWKSSHNGDFPQKYADKIAFRQTIATAARTNNSEGGEENYDEAVAAVLKTITLPTLSSSVREVFSYSPDVEEAQSVFWVITDAVKRFYAKHGVLPLPGSVPDMKAESQVYVRLQSIYKNKARQDVAEVIASIRAHAHGDRVTTEEVETYCKNAAFIKLIRGTNTDPEALRTLAVSELEAEYPPSLMHVYLALKASEDAEEQTPSSILKNISNVVPAAHDNAELVKAAHEVARAQHGELHNISSLVGGMVAQEIIKIITKQYVPIDNTCCVTVKTEQGPGIELFKELSPLRQKCYRERRKPASGALAVA